jgi:hypothetical protein
MQAAVASVDWPGLVDMIFKLALLPIAVAAVVYLAKLAGMKFTDQQTEDLKHSLSTGLLAAEQQAIQAWKNHGVVIADPEKTHIAIVTAREVSKTGLAGKSDEQVERLIAAETIKQRPLLSSPPPPSPSESAPPPPILSSRPPAK